MKLNVNSFKKSVGLCVRKILKLYIIMQKVIIKVEIKYDIK